MLLSVYKTKLHEMLLLPVFENPIFSKEGNKYKIKYLPII